MKKKKRKKNYHKNKHQFISYFMLYPSTRCMNVRLSFILDDFLIYKQSTSVFKMCNVQHSVHFFLFLCQSTISVTFWILLACFVAHPRLPHSISFSLHLSLSLIQQKNLYIKYIRKMSVNWKWVKRQFFFFFHSSLCARLCAACLSCNWSAAELKNIFFFFSFFSFCFFESRKFFFIFFVVVFEKFSYFFFLY